MKYPPIKYGTRVVTTEANPEIDDWNEEVLHDRQWGVHGLCYEVRHEDGTVGHYDPSELRRGLQIEP